MAGSEPLRVGRRLEIPADELKTSFARAGGPGGQNVNKVESKVVLRFSVRESRALSAEQRSRLLERCAARLTARGEVVIHAARHRERSRNLEDARARLRTLIEEALKPVRPRRATHPTRGSRERRLEGKKRRSRIKRGRRESAD